MRSWAHLPELLLNDAHQVVPAVPGPDGVLTVVLVTASVLALAPLVLRVLAQQHLPPQLLALLLQHPVVL